MQTARVYNHLPFPDMRLQQANARITQLEAEIRLLTLKKENADRFLCVLQGNRLIKVAHSDILYVRAESNYSTIILINGIQYCVCRTLKSIANELPAQQFIRCHRSFLVNQTWILEMDRRNSVIVMEEAQLPVSRRYFRHCAQILFSKEPHKEASYS